MTAGRFTILPIALCVALGCDPGGGSTASSGPIVQQAGLTRAEYGAESARVVAPRAALTVSTRTIAIGGEVLFDAGAGSSAPLAEGSDAVVYVRAPGVTERFACAGQNIEQSWVFDASLENLRTSGPLRIVVRLESGLTAALHEPDDGPPSVLFTDSDGGVEMSYGTALAIDAGGNTHVLSYALAGTDLEMVLDPAFLATAPFPLTVDPLIGSVAVLQPNVRDTEVRPVDVARGNNQWLAAFSDRDDIRVRGITAAGAAGTGAKSAAGNANQVQAAISWSSANDRYLVLFKESPNNGSTHTIRARPLLPDGSTDGDIFSISATDGAFRESPDAACDGTDWLVVWDENVAGTQRVMARAVPVGYDPAGLLATPTWSLGPGAASMTDPAVAALGTGLWFVSWTEGSGASSVIKGRTVTAAGVLGVVRTYSATGASRSDVADGHASGSMLVWERGGNVEAVLLQPDGAPQDAVFALTDHNQAEAPKLAYSAISRQFVVAWHKTGSSAGAYAVRRWDTGATVTGTEGQLNGFPVALDIGPTYPAIAWNSTTDEMVVVFRARSTGGRFNISAQRLSAYEGPANPSALDQARTTGGQTVAVGGFTNETQINLSAASSSPTSGQRYRLQVEVRPVGQAFTSPQAVTASDNVSFFDSPLSASSAAATLTATASSLSHGTAYHWQVRAIDDGTPPLASRWVAYPESGNADNPPTNPAATDFQIDTVAPTVASITRAGASPTNAPEVDFTVTFSEAVTGVDLADFTLAAPVPPGAAVTGVSGAGTTWTVTVGTGTGSGTLRLDVVAGAGIVDQALNAVSNVPFTAGESYVVDRIPPAVFSITRLNASPTNAATVSFSVVFTEPAFGVDAADFALTAVGPVSAVVSSVSGSGTAYTVGVSTGTGDGTLRLDVPATATITDALGNALNAAFTAGETYLIDKTPPTVTSIVRAGASPTNAATVPFTVTFSESVVGVDAGDFVLTAPGLTGVSVASVSGTGPYTVSVNTGAGSGTLRLDVPAGAAVQDTAGNALAGLPFTAGDVYEIDKAGPAVTLASGAPDPTNLAIPVTVTFSEPVGDFEAADIATANGSVANFAGSGTSYTFDLVPDADGLSSAVVDAGVATDALGNPNTASNTLSRTFDATAPGVTLASGAPDPTNAAIPVTVTFSEPVSGFVAGDISTANGTVANFAGGGASYTFDLVAGGDGLVSAVVNAGVATDAAGNPSTASNAISRMFDGTGPTVTLSSPSSDPTNANPIAVTVTFSESVTGFAAGDIAVTNGSVSNFAGSGDTYTFDLVPAGNGAVTVNVAAGVATDAAGNGNTAAAPLSRTYDGTAPTVTLSSPASDPTNANPIAVTVTFSEPVTGFAAGDIAVTNGSVSNFAGSGDTYTFDLVPAGDGTVTVSVAADVAQDSGGNGNSASAPLSRTYDATGPTVALSSTASEPTSSSPIPVTVTFSEPVADFDAGDITPTNATVANFVAVNGTTYTFDLVPTADGIVSADVLGGVAHDALGNPNSAAATLSRTFDSGAEIAPPDQLQVFGLTNPTTVLEVPEFSAVHRWSGPFPKNADRFQIQVSTDPLFGSVTHWNGPATGVLFPSGVVLPDARSPELRYGLGGHGAGALPLLQWNSPTYHWRTRFWDVDGNPSAFSSEPASFRMGSPSVVASANGNGSASGISWRFVGFPIATETTVSAGELFDDVGAVYRWDEPTRKWVVMTAAQQLQGGMGYLISSGPAVVIDLASGSVATGDQSIHFSYTTLAAATGAELDEDKPANYFRGAHFTANPFNRPLDWRTDVSRVNLLPTFQRWDGTQYLTYNALTESGTAGPIIGAFQGIGVNVASDNGAAADLVFLDPPPSGLAPPIKAARVGALSTAGKAEAWALQVTAVSGSALDTENFLGVHPEASDAFDPRDTAEPGTFNNAYVLVFVDHSDWTERPREYTHDVRATPAEAGSEVVWNLTVKSTTNVATTLAWPNFGDLPTADWQYFIQDPATSAWLDLSATPSLQVGPAAQVSVPVKAVRLAAAAAPEARVGAAAEPADAPAGGGGGGNNCGLLGIELLLALGLAAAARRAPATYRR